jgi:hypothetical protein
VPPLVSFIEETADHIRADETFDRLFQEVTINPSTLERELESVRNTASRYPLQLEDSLRRCRFITEELTRVMDVESLTPFKVLGDVSTTLASLSRRLTIYVDETAREWTRTISRPAQVAEGPSSARRRPPLLESLTRIPRHGSRRAPARAGLFTLDGGDDRQELSNGCEAIECFHDPGHVEGDVLVNEHGPEAGQALELTRVRSSRHVRQEAPAHALDERRQIGGPKLDVAPEGVVQRIVGTVDAQAADDRSAERAWRLDWCLGGGDMGGVRLAASLEATRSGPAPVPPQWLETRHHFGGIGRLAIRGAGGRLARRGGRH